MPVGNRAVPIASDLGMKIAFLAAVAVRETEGLNLEATSLATWEVRAKVSECAVELGNVAWAAGDAL